MGFGKFLKKLARSKLVRLGVRAGLGAITGGASAAAIRTAQAAAAPIRRLRAIKRAEGVGKVEPLSVRAQLEKSAVVQPGQMKTFTQATAMPGGAPIPRGYLGRAVQAGRKAVRRAHKATAKAVRRAGKGPSGPEVGKRRGGGRRPPSGGLDLKGLSASWKAAGKPGSWQSWIASHK